MPKYYYTDPIKVLHMMKNFGAEFEIPNEDFDDQDDGFAEPYFDFRLLEIESPETINTLLDMLENGGRIYVKKESEFIFEPKSGDLAKEIDGDDCFGELTFLDNHGLVIPCQDGESGGYYVFDNSEMGSPEIEILKRDDKHFFMPEVEND